MDEKLIGALTADPVRLKRSARAFLIAFMMLPIIFYGPLLWKDGSYLGRWEFAAEMEPHPMACSGSAYLFQHCTIQFKDKTNREVSTINYLVSGTNWNNVVPDIVRGVDGQITTSIAVTGAGLAARIGALLILLFLGLCIERLGLYMMWRWIERHGPIFQQHVQVSKELTLLSRDRRDHF